MKLLIIDDDDEIRDTLRVTLALQWSDATILEAADGLEGIAIAEREVPDLIILDVMMPEMNGFDVCEHLRRIINAPIIMLTVMDRTVDKVRALELGADDFLVKPFDHIELLARMKALLRRTGPSRGIEIERIVDGGEVTLDRDLRMVSRGDSSVKLTAKEEGILSILIQNQGRTVPHRALLANVWGADLVEETGYLKLFIHNLRRKLTSIGCTASIIATERGIGYRFNETPDRPINAPR